MNSDTFIPKSGSGANAAVAVSHILRPHDHFDDPGDILSARHLSIQEKRAILASWASDLYAVESVPALRQPPGLDHPVRYADVIAALMQLDDDREWPRHRARHLL
ncbi:hypothetical protein KX729_30370 [Rhizobium sp. XQZ8]|uniref:hypothetical protein n=1 Tax=Rhizobium populisoli TaxID=2859785 RepID=UPI001CA48C76|nr:hypothetical protein [Rhizobium populisoli]MBW6425699.1 hypothetical protein [Rhizobium populisoli]